jgi:4'-phosphopantetheinyl transferase
VALAVPFWPRVASLSRPSGPLLLAALATPLSTDRSSARQQVRTALCAMLGQHLNRPAADIQLRSQPGQPLRLADDDATIRLSVSHEPGLSLAAVSIGSLIGIDLLHLPAQPEWQAEIDRLAYDYLGPEDAARLAATPSLERAQRFAELWTQQEARLKCLGRALEEWSPALATELARCQVQPLVLPAPYVGSVATAEFRVGGNPAA